MYYSKEKARELGCTDESSSSGLFIQNLKTLHLKTVHPYFDSCLFRKWTFRFLK